MSGWPLEDWTANFWVKEDACQERASLLRGPERMQCCRNSEDYDGTLGEQAMLPQCPLPRALQILPT